MKTPKKLMLNHFDLPGMSDGLIIAHRGRMPGGAGDNTLAAFEQAAMAGAHMIEFDVRRTKDHVIVLHHDRRLGGRMLADQTFAEVRAQAEGSNIPTLAETVTWAKGRVLLDVELKEAGYEQEVLDIVLSCFAPREFVVTSFWSGVTRRVKAHDSRVNVGLLMGWGTVQDVWRDVRDMVLVEDQLRRSGADFLVCHYKQIKAGVLMRAQMAGYPVMVWGMGQRASELAQLGDRRVVGVITDRTDLASTIRGGARLT